MNIICPFNADKYTIKDWIFFKKLYPKSFNHIILTSNSDSTLMINKMNEPYILNLSDMEFFDAIGYFVDMNNIIKDDDIVCICDPYIYFNYKNIHNELLHINLQENFLVSNIFYDTELDNTIYSIGNKKIISCIEDRINELILKKEKYLDYKLFFTNYYNLKQCVKLTDINNPRFTYKELYETMKIISKPIESNFYSLLISSKNEKTKINKKVLLDQKNKLLKLNKQEKNIIVSLNDKEIITNEVVWKTLLQYLASIKLSNIYFIGEYPFNKNVFKKNKNVKFIDKKELTKEIINQTKIAISSEGSIFLTNKFLQDKIPVIHLGLINKHLIKIPKNSKIFFYDCLGNIFNPDDLFKIINNFMKNND